MCWYKTIPAQVWEGIRVGCWQHVLWVQPECFATDIESHDLCDFCSLFCDISMFEHLTMKKKWNSAPNLLIISYSGKVCLIYFIIIIIGHFRAAPEAYKSFCTRGWNGAAATGLHHSNNHSRSEPCLRPNTTAWGNTGSFNPMSKARDQTCILMDTNQILNPVSHNKNSFFFPYF